MKRISINELFSGIGAQRKALLNLGHEVEVVGISEIDKYAIQSYEAIFGKTRNYGDITKIERLDYADLWTYSFPCQDISVAGNQKGISSDTRSGLLYQVQRLLEVAKEEGTLPKYLLLENVKNLVGKKFKSQFDDWIFYLDQLGYETYWQVLNAKNYGIPQNRERVFALSIRKDLNKKYVFPEKEKLVKRLADLLEDEVDEKFYLNEEQINKIKFSNFNTTKSRIQEKNICNTLCARDYKDPKCVRVKEATTEGIISTHTAGNRNMSPSSSILIAETKIQQVGNIVSTGNWNNPQRGRIYSPQGLSPALNIVGGGGLEPKIIDDAKKSIRIRKLTPFECWRLMGFDDEDFKKAQASGVSNSQLYKQAGNSIVVNVLEKIFENMLKEKEKTNEQVFV